MRTSHLLVGGLMALALAGCNKDADGDGWGEKDDCDDADASIHPDADEVCDGVDNDCDGETDEDSAIDASSWYLDMDLDGFGDATTAQQSCEAPAGYIADGTDCNDRSDRSWPGATEYCDGDDNDCDGFELDAGAGWVSADDVASDVSAAVDGTETSIATFTIEEEGSLYFCGGEFWTSVEITQPVPVSIVGVGGAELNTIRGGAISHTGDDGGRPSDAMGLTVEGLTFDGNTAQVHGVVSNTYGHVTVLDSVFTGTFSNTSAGVGSQYGDVTLERVTASDFTGSYGVAFTSAGSISVVDSEIRNGSDIAVYQANLDSELSTTIEGSVIDGMAGVAIVAASALTLTDSSVTNSYRGVSYSTSVDCVDSSISNNDLGGGGVVGGGPVTLSGCEINDNLHTVDGGGLSITGDLIATDSTVSGNSSTADGGGVYASGRVDLDTSTISGNTASQDGGGIWAEGNVSLQSSEVSGNAGDDGGGIYTIAADLTVLDSTISGNTASNFGAGVNLSGGDLRMEDSAVEANVSSNAAGGAWLDGGDATLTNSAIRDNDGADFVGGIGLTYGRLTCTGATDTEAGVWGNSATNFGGIWYNSGGVVATDCDMGTGDSDNSPDDVYASPVSLSYTDYGDDASFTCGPTGCI